MELKACGDLTKTLVVEGAIRRSGTHLLNVWGKEEEVLRFFKERRLESIGLALGGEKNSGV